MTMPENARSRASLVRDARRLLRPLRRSIVSLAQALVRVDSVAMPPDGHETRAQRVLRALQEAGVVHLDVEPVGLQGVPQHALGAALKAYRLDVEMYDTGFLERSRH